MLKEENCLLKAARAFLVFKAIEDIGEVIKSDPSVQDIEDEKFELLCRTAVEEKCSVLNCRPITLDVAKELLIKAYNRV